MTYLLSDIHGNLRRFSSVLQQISLQPEDTLYILGDVIDRHPDGIELLQRIRAMPNARLLLGNHEYMMLRALGQPYDGPEDIFGKNMADLLELWYYNGGWPTHEAWSRLGAAERQELLDYLKGLPLNLALMVNGRAYKLVHGAPLENWVFYGQSGTETFFAVWNRIRAARVLASGETVIFGHTPTADFQRDDPLKIWHGRGQIGIDCGCGSLEPTDPGYDQLRHHGRLGCLRLEDMREFYSEEG